MRVRPELLYQLRPTRLNPGFTISTSRDADPTTLSNRASRVNSERNSLDVSVAPAGRSDTSPGSAHDRYCTWCHCRLPIATRQDAKTCSKQCRQASWRFGVAPGHQTTDRPMRFAYADPPYPGKAHYYPEQQEVDHVSLLETLQQQYPDGWALSTSSRSLRDILLLCPPTVRVCAWFKGPRPTKSRRALCAWEPVLVSGGRALLLSKPAPADGLIARGRFRAFPGAMIGMKPPTFAEWLFQLLGAMPLDHLDDLFPGSGAISVAWARFCGAEFNATVRSYVGPVALRSKPARGES